jgi:CDP-glucose 4,6-dehydratase
MSNILITGANGFVGAALAKRLCQDKNNNVVGFIKDFNSKTQKDVVEQISVTRGDLRNFDDLCFAISHYEIDTIYHVGAVTILRQSFVDPRSCYAINTMGTVNVLEAARLAGKNTVKKIVIASSDKAYGTQPKLPYTEDMPMCAEDPYSTSKACTDLIGRSYHHTYEMDINIIRSGNIYGPGDLNFSRLIPKSILKILDNQAPQIYSGVAHFRREFMFIDDVVDAYITVANKGAPGEAYNVAGSGFISVIDAVRVICKVMGSDLNPEIIQKDFIEIKDQFLCPKKIEALGWKCEHTMEEGIEKAFKWYRKYKAAGGICNIPT